jgi:hypothetical protein
LEFREQFRETVEAAVPSEAMPVTLFDAFEHLLAEAHGRFPAAFGEA